MPASRPSNTGRSRDRGRLDHVPSDRAGDQSDDFFLRGLALVARPDASAPAQHDHAVGYFENVLQVTADGDNRLTVGFQVRDELVDLGLLLDAKGRYASMRTPKSHREPEDGEAALWYVRAVDRFPRERSSCSTLALT